MQSKRSSPDSTICNDAIRSISLYSHSDSYTTASVCTTRTTRRCVACGRVGVWAVDTSLRQIITTVHSGHLSRVSRSAIRQRWHQKYLFTAHRHVKWNGISSIKINRYCIRIKLLRILEGTLPHRSRQVPL